MTGWRESEREGETNNNGNYECEKLVFILSAAEKYINEFSYLYIHLFYYRCLPLKASKWQKRTKFSEKRE